MCDPNDFAIMILFMFIIIAILIFAIVDSIRIRVKYSRQNEFFNQIKKQTDLRKPPYIHPNDRMF